MSLSPNPIARRTAMRAIAIVAGAIGIQSLAAVAGRRANAESYGQTPKTVVKYTDVAPDRRDCSTCQQFIPGPTPGADGYCKVVAGSISPRGWCIIWAAKT